MISDSSFHCAIEAFKAVKIEYEELIRLFITFSSKLSIGTIDNPGILLDKVFNFGFNDLFIPFHPVRSEKNTVDMERWKMIMICESFGKCGFA
jgi:hypothetical protein